MKETIKEAAFQIAKIGSGIYLEKPSEEALEVLIELDRIALKLFRLADKIPA